MTSFIIPLSPTPQTFTIALGGADYRLTFTYQNCDMGGWVMDIATVDGLVMAGGIPLVTGADLLQQYAFMGMGGQLVVESLDEAVPSFENLGSSVNLVWNQE